MKGITAAIKLTLAGPILTHASEPGAIGIDSPVARNYNGVPYLPFSLIKGRIRQSWDELGYHGSGKWFGDRPLSGDFKPARGRFAFSDFVAEGSYSTAGVRHRIAISPQTGAADDGALQIIESPFAPGEPVQFSGTVSWLADEPVAADFPLETAAPRVALENAFRWTPNFGSGRTSGFGRVMKIDVTVTENDSIVTQRLDAVPVKIELKVQMLDPFCVSKQRVSSNIFESDTILSGAVLRGYLASTINQATGSNDGTDVSDLSIAPTLWPALRSSFNNLRFTHAFPTKAGGQRPRVPPLSLVKAGGNLYDVALCEGPTLIDSRAPEFRVDWKSCSDVDLAFKWPPLERQLRVRTAIDRVTRRAQDEQLFAYEMIVPHDDVVWTAMLDLDGVKQNRAAVVEDLQSILSLQRPGIGKSKARAEVTIDTSETPLAKVKEAGPWIITLQTPTLLCDPLELGLSAGRDELGAEYARVIEELSRPGENEKPSLKLVRYFASQSLAGGYLTRRFQADKQYFPFLLTDAGSVFIVDTADEASESGAIRTLESWLNNGMSLPPWAISRYGYDWRTNPFRPSDGFGEIAIDNSKYPTPASSPVVRIGSPHPGAGTNPKLAERSITPAPEPPRDSVTRTGERWNIRGLLTTMTPFHLGDGGIAYRPALDAHEGKEGIEVASVAVTPRVPLDEGVRPYIPGSSLKGALRARLESGGIADKELEFIFGKVAVANDSGSGGAVDFHDAVADIPDESVGANVPWWDARRLTGVATSVSIDRRTRTAEERKLFHREYVPPGVSFAVTIAADGLEEPQAKMLLDCLNTALLPISLGKETSNGWGQFSWTEVSVTRLKQEDRASWLKRGSSGFEDLGEEIELAASPQGGVSATITLPLTISFDGPFLVNDPSRSEVKKKKKKKSEKAGAQAEPELPNHATLVDADRKPILPGSSLRGALRFQAERIVRTLRGDACTPAEPCKLEKDPANVEASPKLSGLCPVCLLFGTTGWASLLKFAPFVLKNSPQEFTQEFVAIDRFTGGAADGAKFDAATFWRPEFVGSIAIDARRASEAVRARCLGLLALTLRDLSEGDIPIGFGSAKGYGACTASWTETDAIKAAIRSFRNEIMPSVEQSEPQSTVQQADGPSHYPVGPQRVASEATGDNDFHNPYAFVPTVPGASPTKSLDSQLTDDATHASYLDGRSSGRIQCTLRCETPVVIGSTQSKDANELTIVAPFAVDGKPALPASSLRGLISSLAEAASNSALRVLADRTYSRRMEAREAFRSLGMIIIRNGKRLLRPLGNAQSWKKLGKYQSDTSVVPPRLQLVEDSVLALVAPDSFSADSDEVWEATEVRGRITRLKPAGPIGEFLKRPRRGLFGIVRILGIEDREEEIPQSKKWELFIPIDSIGTSEIDVESAAAEFEAMASELPEGLPFLWKGATERTDGEGEFHLREHDLVFYESKPSGVALSISQIWRRPIERSTHDYFAAISKAMLPFGAPKGGNRSLTPAELMFGFVNPQRSAKDEPQALASRIRFGFGLPLDAEFDSEVTLRQLASPKPPSPAMYFHRSSGSPISKRSLGHSDRPNGRKFYLHHRSADVLTPTSEGTDGVMRWSWETHITEGADARLKGKSAVRPIKRGSEFKFDVRFDNLTRSEIGLLLYTLRPTDQFRHKLGMGKPLGLGSIRIDIDSVECDDRFARYASDTKSRAPLSSWPEVAAEWRDGMDHSIRQAIEVIGDPDHVVARVHYPTTVDQPEDGELELFKWFEENDERASSGSRAQAVGPFSGAATTIPVLRRDLELSVPDLQAQPNLGVRENQQSSPRVSQKQDHKNSRRSEPAGGTGGQPNAIERPTGSAPAASQLDGIVRIEGGVVVAVHGEKRIPISDMTPGCARTRETLGHRKEMPARITVRSGANGELLPLRIEPIE